jgi:hypothetical protein
VIGVIPGKDELGVVEEFFQLFKTPWELYRPGESYDVVLVTEGGLPEVNARLVILFGSELTRADLAANLSLRARRRNAALQRGGQRLPLYGELLTFQPANRPAICPTVDSEIAGVELNSGKQRVVRIGYDLFQEIAFLLTTGQPVEQADVPALELHIALVRDLILDSGIPFLEIPPTPADYDFAVCLTHDIDFVGIRRHKFDHTMWGFLYRATAGAALNFLRGKTSFARLLKSWKAAASLPFVYLGWAKDFWLPFDWYMKVEQGLSPTYYFIPFKHRRGDRVTASHADRRASAYDVTDITGPVAKLLAEGCEVGVHGIDAWHSVEKGREELKQVAAVAGRSDLGIRMHWLLRDENTYRVLEQAGYAYDSTAGYNEAPGYRCGTTQAFRPLTASTLLELPMHIQDGALFFPGRLGLTDAEAWRRCETFLANAEKLGGVLTLLWHDRSHGPERFWGEFYAKLVANLKARRVWFATGAQVVNWFRQRREVTFERTVTEDGVPRVRVNASGSGIHPPLRIRIHSPESDGQKHRFTDATWDGQSDADSRLTPESDPSVCVRAE